MSHWPTNRYPYQLFYGYNPEDFIGITQEQYDAYTTAKEDQVLHFPTLSIKQKDIKRVMPVELPPERLAERTPQDTNLLEESIALLKADPDPIRYRDFKTGAWTTFATKKDLQDYLTHKKNGLR
jgi:hypothetical protein